MGMALEPIDRYLSAMFATCMWSSHWVHRDNKSLVCTLHQRSAEARAHAYTQDTHTHTRNTDASAYIYEHIASCHMYIVVSVGLHELVLI